MRAHPPLPPACPTTQVMSLCDETLEERMRRGALGEPGAQLTACRELCEGLAYLHQLPEPIAHRDIKPANLLFRGAPQPSLPRPHSPVHLHLGERASPSPAPFFTVGAPPPPALAAFPVFWAGDCSDARGAKPTWGVRPAPARALRTARAL